jgi:hypothetical protein
MIRKILGALTILVLSIGFVVAEEFKGKVTKVDGTKITVENKKANATKEFNIAGAKIQKKSKDATEAAEASAIKEGSAVSVTFDGDKVSEVTIMGKKK